MYYVRRFQSPLTASPLEFLQRSIAIGRCHNRVRNSQTLEASRYLLYVEIVVFDNDKYRLRIKHQPVAPRDSVPDAAFPAFAITVSP